MGFVVLREIMCGKLEKLTGGWRELQLAFGGMRFVVLRDILGVRWRS